ncbi:class I SAM-dependent DNA methyltransferase [Micromonospora antibiotica]|uniref:Methyltransferase domain-containing protein n=1 Tax=Micromonospora antibiotica TaxID=2807623 RepID=A0ABS3V8L2_9ACTN|nr:SAM-dependent methyltransferase [Micromonospora antibiotica]MBO4161955.1 methyltransferase domain-containing protein [Micromonospora antibiotica]
MTPPGTPAEYFDGMYAGAEDPWGFATRWYDQRKHDVTVACLPRRRYRSAFEPGCSTGMLTRRLAERCDRLLAVDIAAAPVASARERLADQPHVRVERMRVPDEWPAVPDDRFDLVVLSELGYYFDDAGLDRLVARTVDSLAPGGTLVAVHWRPAVAEHARGGDDVHRLLGGVAGLARTARHEEADFLLDVFLRVPPPARSVAQTDGLW